VKFELNGFGENENESPFENKTPEERSYNRTVIIDVIVPTIKVSNNKLIFKFRKGDRQQSILFFFNLIYSYSFNYYRQSKTLT
jgi:hypothetical protein